MDLFITLVDHLQTYSRDGTSMTEFLLLNIIFFSASYCEVIVVTSFRQAERWCRCVIRTVMMDLKGNPKKDNCPNWQLFLIFFLVMIVRKFCSHYIVMLFHNKCWLYWGSWSPTFLACLFEHTRCVCWTMFKRTKQENLWFGIWRGSSIIVTDCRLFEYVIVIPCLFLFIFSFICGSYTWVVDFIHSPFLFGSRRQSSCTFCLIVLCGGPKGANF